MPAQSDAVTPTREVPWWILPAGVLLLGLLLSIPFWLTDLDVQVARLVQAWNLDHGGAQQDAWWWRLPYQLPTVLVAAMILGALTAIIRGLRRRSSDLVRQGVYVLLVLTLGCGVLVNVILKDHWGRPRPRDTVAFGGSEAYVPPWIITDGNGKSFPSGHVAVPAATLGLWMLWRRRRPRLARWCLAGSLMLTAWVGAVRMLALGHWLSDVLWATVLMFVVAALLHRLLLHGRPAEAASGG